MTIQPEKVAALSYKLSVSNAANPKQLVETVDSQHPMYFLVGNSGLPPAFEGHLNGLKAGDSFNFTISSADGFGKFDEMEVMNLPIEDFLDSDGKLDPGVFQVGKFVPMMDEHENHIRGRILEINHISKYIRMDFNHPLAGQDMHFEGKVEIVRDATHEELSHGHVHGEGGHHH